MKCIKFIILLTSLFLFSCSNREMADQNAKLKEQISDLKSQLSQQNAMMERMRASDDKLMILALKISGVKARIVTNMGNIDLKFFPEEAPIQCFNFITRAECGFYDNTQFHRVMKDFMIQGGDPNTKTQNKNSYGAGGPIVNVPNEFNQISHKRGILSTARTPNPNDGAGSQFFIVHKDYPSLDKQYTVFGEVVKGMDVVDKIATSKTNKNNLPLNPVVIKTIEVFR